MVAPMAAPAMAARAARDPTMAGHADKADRMVATEDSGAPMKEERRWPPPSR